jgi:hypothetical protein
MCAVVAGAGRFERLTEAVTVEMIEDPSGSATVIGWNELVGTQGGQAWAIRKRPVLPVSAMAEESLVLGLGGSMGGQVTEEQNELTNGDLV